MQTRVLLKTSPPLHFDRAVDLGQNPCLDKRCSASRHLGSAVSDNLRLAKSPEAEDADGSPTQRSAQVQSSPFGKKAASTTPASSPFGKTSVGAPSRGFGAFANLKSTSAFGSSTFGSGVSAFGNSTFGTSAFANPKPPTVNAFGTSKNTASPSSSATPTPASGAPS